MKRTILFLCLAAMSCTVANAQFLFEAHTKMLAPTFHVCAPSISNVLHPSDMHVGTGSHWLSEPHTVRIGRNN